MGLTHREQFNKRHGFDKDASHSKADIKKVTGIPSWALDEIYDRGIGAHETNLKSVRLKGSFIKNVDAPASAKLSPEQWAMARIYAFINKIEAGRTLNHDIDVFKKVKHLIKSPSKLK